MERKGVENNSAQINIDFLSGISIFLVSFILVVQLVPNLFIPFQDQPVTLHSVAYRTSVILCEDPGWYNGTLNDSGVYVNSNGTNWEDHPDNLSRIGLAMNKFSSNLSTPMMLSDTKVITMAGLYNSSDPGSYANIQEKLGLVTSYRRYDFNISMIRLDDNYSAYMNGTPILQMGLSPVPNTDVEKVERIVSLEKFGLTGYTYRRIDNPGLHTDIINVGLPVYTFKIIIESKNFLNGEDPHICLKIHNCSGCGCPAAGCELMNRTFHSPTDMPLVLDLADDLNKYTEFDQSVKVEIKCNNINGYYYLSNAGDLISDKLAARIIVQVW
jgi:hypothetical protein